MSAAIPAHQLPELRVLRASSLVLHEEADSRRTALLHHRLLVEQVVKNPVVVTALDPEGATYVVLDGANRTSALWALGVPHVVVQVVDYARVELTTWLHLVVGMDATELRAGIAAIPGVDTEEMPLAAARREWRARRALGYLTSPGCRTVLLIRGAGTAVRGSVETLKAVVATYEGRADIYRVQDDSVSAFEAYYSELAGVVVFPPYSPAEILDLAARQVKLPTGITRHVIPHRALRLNTELRFLWSDATLAEKNRWLAEWTRHKLQVSEVRFYEESTFLFDE